MKVKEKNTVVLKDVEIQENNNNTENVKSIKKRDASIELIRIVACITVVLIHLSLNVFDQYHSQVDWSRLFEKCFFTDGVPLFYMIMGFFIANGRSYKKMWKNTFKRVVIPTLLYVWFAQVFYMFIINKQNIAWCLKNAFINSNIPGITRTIITGEVVHINSLCDHLWYIISYLKIMIWVPVLWLICKEEDNSKLARRIILILSSIAMIITDIQRFITLPVGVINVFEMIDPDIFYVILGYELFVHKDKIKNNKKLCIISLVTFVLANVLRYKAEMQYMIDNNFYEVAGRVTFANWKYTFLNVISGLSLFMGLYSFDIKNEKIAKCINWVADKTFGIYLIHYLLLAKIDLYKFDKIGTFIYELIYLAVGLVVIFTASLLIVCLLRFIKKLFLKLFSKLIKTKKEA